jgi:hypothetical protein
MYKICCSCKVQKLIDNFSRNSSRKDGHNTECKSCVKNYQLIHKKQIADKKKVYYETNKHHIVQYNQTNKTRIAIVKSQYQKENRDKVNATAAKRRAVKLKATPNWLTKEDIQKIEQFYTEAQKLKNITGQDYHVDHIIPLQSEIVCGLHVPWNLQVIAAKENRSKSNRLIE